MTDDTRDACQRTHRSNSSADAKAADVGGQALTDAYAGLNASPAQARDGSEVVKAIEVVEARPESAGRKETLKEEIAASKLDQDEEIGHCAASSGQPETASWRQSNCPTGHGSYTAQAEGGSTANVQVDSPRG
jgi:hypothetical protein